MKCPRCETTLLMADKNGVEIDYCPQCRGIWLDRGELEKIIERTYAAIPQANYGPQPQPNYAPPPVSNQPYYDKHHDKHHDHNYNQPYDSHNYKQHRRKSFLEDIFDFG